MKKTIKAVKDYYELCKEKYNAVGNNDNMNMNGEQACQEHGYSKEQCYGVGCCQWVDGACWSNVGSNPCFGKK